MPQLTIQGSTFDYPDAGEEPGWGEDATAWAEAVTDVINFLVNPGDILETSFTLLDNTAVAANVVGMRFDSSIVRAANVNYSINRNGANQSGTLHLNYNSSAAPGSKWTLQENTSGDVGVVFSVTDLGQVQYTTSSTGFNGAIKFTARTLSQ